MNISTRGVNLIKSFEGFSARPYDDGTGTWTIGYGHIEGVHQNSPWITEPQAATLLARDLNHNYAPAINALRLPLNQNQFDALVSFVYNLGVGIVGTGYSVGRLLRQHQWHAAADDMLNYDHANGVVWEGLRRRRLAERHLFLIPVGRAQVRAAKNTHKARAKAVKKSAKATAPKPLHKRGRQTFNMGGFVPPGMPFTEERDDQGKDFQIPINHWIVAPGYCEVLEHNSDSPFPSGFGSPYVSKLRIYSGRFKGLDVYLGHANSNVPPVGKVFRAGERLVPLTNSLNAGWGWIEIGILIHGAPGPDGTGARYHTLFRPVTRFV